MLRISRATSLRERAVGLLVLDRLLDLIELARNGNERAVEIEREGDEEVEVSYEVPSSFSHFLQGEREIGHRIIIKLAGCTEKRGDLIFQDVDRNAFLISFHFSNNGVLIEFILSNEVDLILALSVPPGSNARPTSGLRFFATEIVL